MRYISVFRHKEIGIGNYLVTEDYGKGHCCHVGVIVGGERILVIDTGLGFGGNLRKYIESFSSTQIPIFCMCTHGDADCLGGLGLFDEAYLNSRDAAGNPAFDRAKRLKALDALDADEDLRAFAALTAEDISGAAVKDMKQDDHHHLGGVHVGVFELPGATPGSCVIRVTREGVARTSFVGDALAYERVKHLSGAERTAYVERLRALAAITTEDEPLYGTHSGEPLFRADIEALADRLAAEA